MKCPKCEYLGFETGDRCKNCGYDFSLVTDSATVEPDLPLRESTPPAGPNDWLHQLDRGLELVIPSSEPGATSDPLAPMPLDTVVVPAAATAAGTAPADAPRPSVRVVTPPLPLFTPGSEDDDQPLIKLPAAPRPPLAVRRTPETPRLRAVPKATRRAGAEAAARLVADPEPVLEFPDDSAEVPAQPEPLTAPARRRVQPVQGVTSGAGRRIAAALVDHAILLGIDAVVVYLTLKMAALTIAEWNALPLAPLLLFLGMVKAAYFCAFTLVGGQTVGKMAARIRVVSLDGGELDPPRVIRRTLAGAVSLLTLGAGFIPALVSADRRALHDHMARTRVVELPSA